MNAPILRLMSKIESFVSWVPKLFLSWRDFSFASAPASAQIHSSGSRFGKALGGRSGVDVEEVISNKILETRVFRLLGSIRFFMLDKHFCSSCFSWIASKRKKHLDSNHKLCQSAWELSRASLRVACEPVTQWTDFDAENSLERKWAEWRIESRRKNENFWNRLALCLLANVSISQQRLHKRKTLSSLLISFRLPHETRNSSPSKERKWCCISSLSLALVERTERWKIVSYYLQSTKFLSR